MDGAVGLRTSTGPAIEWVRGSLAMGSSLAMLLTQRLATFEAAWLLVPTSVTIAPLSLDDHRRGVLAADETPRTWARMRRSLKIAPGL